MATVISGPWPRAPEWPCKRLLPSPLSDDMCAPWRRDAGAGFLRHMGHATQHWHGRLSHWPTPCRVSRAPDHAAKAGFLGRWGTHSCPQRLPSDIVPIRSWTRTLRLPGIRHRHLPCHAMHTQPLTATATRMASRRASVTDICHAMPCHAMPCHHTNWPTTTTAARLTLPPGRSNMLHC